MRQKVFEPKDVSSRMSEVAPDALRGLIQFGRMPYLGRVVSVLLLWCCVIVVLINLRFFRKKKVSEGIKEIIKQAQTTPYFITSDSDSTFYQVNQIKYFINMILYIMRYPLVIMHH